MARFRLLSIDGGGIRGLIPALVLSDIEHRTGRPAHQLFDAIAGTSTGGIIALGLAKNISARAIVNLYKEEGAAIFHEGWLRRAAYGVLDHAKVMLPKDLPRLPHHAVPSDIWDPKYAAAGRRKVLQRVFEDTALASATTRVFITSYETSSRMPVFFVARAQDASHGPYHEATANGTMLDAAMATSAAPTYFPPHPVERDRLNLSVAGTDLLSFVDGGIFANNPTGLAHSMLNQGALGSDDVIFSLGTGGMTQPYPFRAIEDWGALNWTLPTLKMMFDGQSEAVALALHSRLPSTNYVRLQAYLSPTDDPDSDDVGTSVSDDLDNATPANIEAMEVFATRLIRRHEAAIDRVCALLTR